MALIPRRFISVGILCRLDTDPITGQITRRAVLVGRNTWYLNWEKKIDASLVQPGGPLVAGFPPSMVTVDKRGGIITINVDVASSTTELPHAELVFDYADEILRATGEFYLNEKPPNGWKLALAGCPSDNFKHHRKEGSH